MQCGRRCLLKQCVQGLSPLSRWCLDNGLKEVGSKPCACLGESRVAGREVMGSDRFSNYLRGGNDRISFQIACRVWEKNNQGWLQECWLGQLSDGVVLYWHGEDHKSKFGEGRIRHSALALQSLIRFNDTSMYRSHVVNGYSSVEFWDKFYEDIYSKVSVLRWHSRLRSWMRSSKAVIFSWCPPLPLEILLWLVCDGSQTLWNLSEDHCVQSGLGNKCG